MSDPTNAKDPKCFEQFLDHYGSIHNVHRPDIEYQDGLAASTTNLMISAIIFINAGALVALSQLKDAVDRQSLWFAALLFVVGLVLALLTGACQIWNARSISAVYRHRMNVQMADIIRAGGTGSVDEAALATEVGKYPGRQRNVIVTMWVGWVVGLLSVVAFVIAAAVLMWGSVEPLKPTTAPVLPGAIATPAKPAP